MKHPSPEPGEDWRNGGFGLYVHWPFCAAKCPYCDFNSHVAKSIEHANWRDAYALEISRLAKLTPGRTLDSIFFGGGTPSTMDPGTVAEVIRAARDAWPTRNSIEITIEANPTSVELEKFRDFSGAGVNRLSLGVQSLDDDALRLLGRLHSAKDAFRAWDVANLVFERTSFDLIYARQYQSYEQWRSELEQALALNPTHLSLYQLTIEDGTAFGDRFRAGKLRGLPSEDVGADMFELTQEVCAQKGLPSYEVSNHARDGFESTHNQIYWRYGDYVGVGPGAHGRLTIAGQRYAYEAQKQPALWLKSALQSSLEHESVTPLSCDEQFSEFLMMGLRLSEGTDLSRVAEPQRLSGLLDRAAGLIEQGFLWKTGDQLGTTMAGRQVLNSVLKELL